jgi:uncharacterized membrane protein
MKVIKSKVFLFIGIILLVVGIILINKVEMDMLGLVAIVTGVTIKIIYIFAKVKSGEYKPGKELMLLVIGLLLFLTGLYLQGINQTLIKPIYLITFGIILKILFIIKFIQIVQSKKKSNTTSQTKKSLF